MSWQSIASGTFASIPSVVEGPARVVAGLKEIVAFMREPESEPAIILTNVAGGSAVSTIIKRAKAIISTIGGPNSHIVVVARDYRVPCIVGAAGLDLAALAGGARLRLCADGTVQIWNQQETAQPSLDQLRVLRNVDFAGAVASASEIVGAGPEAGARLKELLAAGLIEDAGAISVTSAGSAALAAWYVRDRSGLDAATREKLHQEFRPLDQRVKKIATAWQDADMRDNWDGRVAATESLASLHADTLRLFDRYAPLLPRLEEYRSRLSDAVQHVMNGDTEYFVKVQVDSYHTIWFQLHEDLLRLLEKERDPES
jgi:phosphohistidine swiveling domain-containing protein